MSFIVENESELEEVPQETDSSPASLEPIHEHHDEGLESPTDEEAEREEEEPSCLRKSWRRAVTFWNAYQFPLLIILSIALARAYPPLGAEYLAPEITATWIAVAIIFVLAGMGLKTEEFSKAFQRIYFNGYVQTFNFGLVSAIVFAFSRLLKATNVLNEALADGMVICACLPMAINVVIVLTASAGGDEAAAVFNATFGNIIGIFLSPVLILLYLGTTGDISLGDVFYKLTLRVIVPLIVGQVVQKVFKQVRDFFVKHKRRFKKLQEYCLVFIVYTVFCRTFEEDVGAGIGDTFLMILFQFLILILLMGVAWISLRFLFHDEPELIVMGLFGCVQKTVALGVPLISSIYGGDPNEGLYTLPILIWHPMQLVVGSLLVPCLSRFIQEERERLKAAAQESDQTVAVDIEAPDELAICASSRPEGNDDVVQSDDELQDHSSASEPHYTE